MIKGYSYKPDNILSKLAAYIGEEIYKFYCMEVKLQLQTTVCKAFLNYMYFRFYFIKPLLCSQRKKSSISNLNAILDHGSKPKLFCNKECCFLDHL